MQAILVTRDGRTDASGNITTSDWTLTVDLSRTSNKRSDHVTQLPESEWPGSSNAGSHPSVRQQTAKADSTIRRQALPKFSPFGSGETDEFATWIQGRECLVGSSKLREDCQDDMRYFAERSDHTEGIMLSSPISDGFGGFSSAFLELLRDDYAKTNIFTTAMITDAGRWRRQDDERNRAQRLLNESFSIQQMEELSSMLLPIQPPRTWENDEEWAKFLRRDTSRLDSYAYVLNAHLQSANSELREPDSLNSIIAQLNWRNENKIAHLVGATPLLPPSQLGGKIGASRLKVSRYDFSKWTTPKASSEAARPTSRAVDRQEPFAMHNVVRGYGDEETQQLGPILEGSTKLQEPLSSWVCLPDAYPHAPTAPAVFRSLLPNGRPIILQPPLPQDPSKAPYGIFGAPDPLVLHTQENYFVQPNSVPILTTLETTPEARHYLRHLASGVKELLRIRSRVLWEYEEGEHGLGRDGIVEARERLESLADRYAAGVEEDENASDGQDEDEHWAQEEDELDRELME